MRKRVLGFICLLGFLGSAAPFPALGQTTPSKTPAKSGDASPKSPKTGNQDSKKNAPPAKQPTQPKAGNAGLRDPGRADAKPAKSGAKAAGGVRLKKAIVRFSYIPGPQALPTIVARERGFFRREGLIVSALPVTRQQAIVDSLRAGITDFATGTQAWLLDIAQANVPAKVIALNGHERAMEIIVPTWDRRTKKIADLKGKTVLMLTGTHNFDAIPEFFKILAFNKLRLGEVRFSFINLDQLRGLFSNDRKVRLLWKRQSVGAFFGYREHTDFYVEKKLARVVMPNEQIRRLLGRNGPRPLFASALIVKEHPETVQRFVNAWVAALDYISSNEEQSMRLLRIYLARQFGRTLSKERARFYLNSIKYTRVEWSPQDIKEANINAKMIRLGRNILWSKIKDPDKRPFKTVPNIQGYIDNRFVLRAIEKLKADKQRQAARADKKAPAAKKDDGDPKTRARPASK